MYKSLFFVEVIMLLDLYIVYIYVSLGIFLFSSPCHNYKIYRNINNVTVLFHTFLLYSLFIN